MALDDKVRAYLRELGATVALEKRGRRSSAALPSSRRGALQAARAAENGEGSTVERAVFQINVKDLSFLRSVGIDPTRPIRSRRRAQATVTIRSTVAKRG